MPMEFYPGMTGKQHRRGETNAKLSNTTIFREHG